MMGKPKYSMTNLIALGTRKEFLLKEKAGKENVLNGEFSLVEKGNPHYSHKKFIESELLKNKAEIQRIEMKLNKMRQEW